MKCTICGAPVEAQPVDGPEHLECIAQEEEEIARAKAQAIRSVNVLLDSCKSAMEVYAIKQVMERELPKLREELQREWEEL